MYLVVTNNRTDVTSDDNCSAFHRTAFDCLPGPFAHLRVRDFVKFDTSIITLTIATSPIEIDAQLDIMYSIFADHQVRNIIRAHAAPIQLHFKPFDPEPVPPVTIERLTETRHLPGMIGRIVQTAHIESTRFNIPTFIHRYIAMPATLQQACKIIIHVETLLITRQVCNGGLDFSGPYT